MLKPLNNVPYRPAKRVTPCQSSHFFKTILLSFQTNLFIKYGFKMIVEYLLTALRSRVAQLDTQAGHGRRSAHHHLNSQLSLAQLVVRAASPTMLCA